ncbi:MAG: BamA/TamA family outer membrane protein [Saprospiraceae bacterium]|nr:BamA/TamA family outer membrane protein [Saprospiraceae bacterium]
MTSCSSTNNIPENDALYTGANVKIAQTELQSKQAKELRKTLKTLTKPKPNTKLLGIPFKLWMYNLGSEKGIGGWIRRKFGEAPVLFSYVNVSNTEELLDNFMENRGFFQVYVSSETVRTGKKAKVNYEVRTGPGYNIRSLTFPRDSNVLGEAIRDLKSESLLQTGAPFNLDLILAERIRINSILKERGYYFFSGEYLLIEADTSVGNTLVDMSMKIKTNTPAEAKLPYKINDVIIYPNYHLADIREDTSMLHAVEHSGYFVVDSAKMFKPIIFETSMQFKSGDYYSRKDHNATLSRLINFGNFKFVKNRFSMVKDSGQFKLNTYYYLTPLPKKSLRGEITGTSKTNNLIGSQITVSWKNRNTFRGAEQLNVNVFGGTELQINGNFAKTATYRVGGDVSLSVPRFIVPFAKIRSQGEFVPRTNFLIGYEQLNRRTLYTINSIRANYGYIWKEYITKEHQLNPVAINYVKPLNISQLYQDSILSNPALARITEQQFIMGATYNFNFNQLAEGGRETGFYFNGHLDIAGNILGLASGANWKTNDTVSLLGARFAQYLKTEFDIRYYNRLAPQGSFAARLIVGLGYPYGNNREMPFVKQFFAGGNNGLRGFRSRTVGPGSFISPNSLNREALFLPDQSGDLKLELNIEFRRKLFSIFEGALFADAGNVWLLNNDPLRPGAAISMDFLQEMAVDAGFGVRLDFTILLLRFDFAWPLKVPYASTPPDKSMVINLAIGYPF